MALTTTVRTQRAVRPSIKTRARMFGFLRFGPSQETRTQRKNELLEAIKPLNRGASASKEQQAEVEAAATALEQLNPTKKPVYSPLLNGKWRLIYTTSNSILATNRPPFLRPLGPIFQLLDNARLKAANKETWPFFNQVYADLDPLSNSKVAVQFREFKILGLLPIKAPPSAKGELAVTYLDSDLRISRGDKGNLFVLTMEDPDETP